MSDNLEVAIVESGSGTNKLIASVNQLASASDKLASSTDKSAAATKRADDAANKAASSHDHLSKSLGGINSAAGSLQGALAGVGAALSIGKIVEAADAYTQMSNKLRLLTTDQGKISEILEKSYSIAQKTGTGFTEVANTYGKVADQAKKYNLTQEQVGKITQTIAQSIQLTGASAEESANGLRQFAQMLESGQVQAEELNSIVDQTPGLAKALTAGLQASGVAITGSLKQMAEQGKIGVKELLKGLEAIGPSIDKLASTSAPTLSAAMTRVNNAFIKYVGETDKANGFTAKMSGALGLLADNMDKAVPIAVTLTGLLAFGAIGAAINSLVVLGSTVAGVLVPAFTALSAAIVANPLVAGVLLVGLAAGGAAFALFGDKIKATIGPLFESGKAAVQNALGLNQAKTAADAAATSAANVKAANDNSAASWRSVTEAATPAATAVTNAATQAGTAATNLTTANNQITLIKGGFTELATSATQAGTGFTAVSTSAAASAGGFQVLSMGATGAQTALAATGTAATTAATATTAASAAAAAASVGITTLGTAVGNASINLDNSNVSLNNFSSQTMAMLPGTDAAGMSIDNIGNAAAAASPKVATMTELIAQNGRAASAAAQSTDDVAKAQKELEIRMQASAKAASDFNKQIEKVQTLNAYGEKLKTITEFLSDFKEAQDRANKSIEDSFSALAKAGQAWREHESALLGLSDSAGNATSSVGSLTSSLGDNTNALLSTGSAADRAANAYDNLGSSMARAASQRWTPGNDVYYSGGGGSGSGGGSGGGGGGSNGFSFPGNYVTPLVVDGVTIGSFDQPTINGNGDQMLAADKFAQEFTNRWTNYFKNNTDLTRQRKIQIITEALSQIPGQLRPWFTANPTWTTGFATGGSFMVGGNGGTDSQHVAFRATPNERVTIETPRQVRRREEMLAASGGPAQAPQRMVQNVGVKIVTADYDGFRRNERQIGQDAAKRIRRAM